MTLISIFRTLKRDTVSLITNMTGLTLGLTASILLSVFIQYELSFDQHFSNSERIYRLNSIWINNEERTVMPINLREAYNEIPDQVSGIETVVQVYRGGKKEVLHGENRYKDLNLLYADPGFFKLFDLGLLSGNAEFALLESNSVVLREEIAIRIFGSNQAIGESFKIENIDYTVTAIMENIPANTHFQFDMMMPMESVQNLNKLGGLEFFSYYMLQENVDIESVLKTICDENTRSLSKKFSNFEGYAFDSNIEPLEHLHLHTSASMDLTPSGSMKTIIIMLVIVITVMILALSNFINLFILSGARRSLEIGVRKVNGASRKNLILQFYLETTVVVSIAFIIGVILSLVLIPVFGSIMQRETFAQVVNSPGLFLVIFILYLFTILLSGLYPALLLSKSSPVSLILGTVNPAGDKRMLLRIVSILQISLAVFLLSTLIGINTQTRYLKNLSPGYNPDGIVLLYNLNDQLTRAYPALRDQILKIQGIEMVAASGHTIGGGSSGQGVRMFGDPINQNEGISEYRIQPGICELYQFNMVNGRFFEPERIADRNCVILNEAAVRMLGSTPEAIVGESVVMRTDPMEVIGVVQDFLYQSAARKVEPLILTAYSEAIRNMAIRITKGANTENTLDAINQTIKSFDNDYIMVRRYAGSIYEGYYKGEERLQNIVGAGSILSILIVLLGIYALVSYNIISRTKEIGIRKVMGGSTGKMLTLIYISTLKWTALASCIGLPLSWIYLDHWLNDYTNRIHLYWWIFAGSILLILLFQSLITLGKTWRTARRNPVDALRYE